MGNQPTNRTGLVFRITEDRKLKAIYTPADEKPPLNLGSLRQALIVGGFADLLIYDHALAELIKRYNAASEAFIFDIGEQRDATFIIRNTPDNLEAYLTLTRPFGGKPVKKEQIYQALRERGIVYGILHNEIEDVLAAGEAVDRLIARGTPPEPGSDGELVSFIPRITNRQPQIMENDTVDYRNLGEIVSVRAGDPLMRRIPPIAGKPGMNLFGKEIPPPAVKDIKFAPNLSGTAFAPDDPDLLIAAIDGQPVLVANGAIVEPVIKVKSVDLSTGNLRFNGSIDVAGDVTCGMKVQATGDIYIGGLVEGATVEARGNIVIHGGIIGQGELRDSEGKLGHEVALVQAGGTVEALFVENARVEAGNSIHIHGFVMQSELVAGREITVGEEGSSKGHIIGGSCQAVNLVRASTIGSHAGVHTVVSAGVDPHARERLSTVRLKIREKEQQLEEIEKRIEYFFTIGDRITPGQIERAVETKEKLSAELMELVSEKKRIQKRLEMAANARIEVQRSVLSGVLILIGTKALEIREDMEGSMVFRLEEDAIVTSP